MQTGVVFDPDRLDLFSLRNVSLRNFCFSDHENELSFEVVLEDIPSIVHRPPVVLDPSELCLQAVLPALSTIVTAEERCKLGLRIRSMLILKP